MADHDEPPERDEVAPPVRSSQASADDAELRGDLVDGGDRDVLPVVDGLVKQTGAGPEADDEFRKGLRERLVAETEESGDANEGS
jgi:hypothetical protein